ncbi:MAG: hypothetical protein WA628_14010 [Terriglobales bacterium]
MTGEESVFCAICLESHVGTDGWFLLTENRWTDRLKILTWNANLAIQPGVHAACGVTHVQQLVAHWMATGSLDYPFARTRDSGSLSTQKRSNGRAALQTEPNTGGTKVLGELAVHRESLTRILTENPESLAGILSALISALLDHQSSSEVVAEKRAEDGVYALTEV